MTALMRVRLKADGRIVEVLADGTERAMPGSASPNSTTPDSTKPGSAPVVPDRRRLAAAYARSVRTRTNLTQVEFASRIGVPIETVRNWEQGKRAPRGPARALLKVIERAPELAFSVLQGPSEL